MLRILFCPQWIQGGLLHRGAGSISSQPLFFIEQGKIRCDDQQLGWEDVLQLAKQRQLQGALTFDEIQKEISGRTARPTETDLSEELQGELKIFAEIYAKSALEAFKNHKKGGRNGG